MSFILNKILIIDYEGGNLASLQLALEDAGGETIISKSSDDLFDVDKVIIPGVGSFNDAVKSLKEFGWFNPLKEFALGENKTLLGICVGMQLLADIGNEGGNNQGLSLINGHVELLKSNSNERVPHMGWNNVSLKKKTELFKNITDNSDFYFAHSYHFVSDDNSDILATTDYCGTTTVALQRENIYGVQFHPEKSSTAGKIFLTNFVNL